MAKHSQSKSFMEVDIPTTKITYSANNKKTGSNKRYVYYTHSLKYNKITKRTQALKHSIGYVNEETGKLVPNDNYFKYFGNISTTKLQPNPDNYVLHYGNYYALNTVFKSLELDEIITNSFDLDAYKTMFDLVNYFISCGDGIVKNISRFLSKNYSMSKRKLDDSLVSSFFSLLKPSEIVDFLSCGRIKLKMMN